MLDAADRAQMVVDASEIVDDKAVMVALRRGTSTLAAQKVRLARRGDGRLRRGDSSEERAAAFLVIGDIGLDIAQDDRFNDSAGNLYRVVFVRPGCSSRSVAECEAVE